MKNNKTVILKNAEVFSSKCVFEMLDVSFSGGEIIDVAAGIKCENADIIDCAGCYVIPGLTDVHFHGCCGHDICDGTDDALKAVAEYEYSCGVTQICPATMTVPDEQLERILKAASAYSQTDPEDSAELVGIHLEGPFISPEKAGAQKVENIQLPSLEKLNKWQSDADGLIRLVTVAPEIDGVLDMIRQASDKYHFSVGHSCCDHDTALKAFKAGADHATHLFNAMNPLHHRETGIIGAASDSDCYVEIICDGIHLSPAAVRMAFRLFGDDRIVLISDSMEATGMRDGEYSLGGQQVNKIGTKAVLADGTLAGSVSTLYDCMLKCISFGIPICSAIKAATVNPCRSIGVSERYGSIEKGKKAAFLILDRYDLSVRQVIG